MKKIVIEVTKEELANIITGLGWLEQECSLWDDPDIVTLESRLREIYEKNCD